MSTAHGQLNEGASILIPGEVGTDIHVCTQGVMWTSCAL